MSTTRGVTAQIKHTCETCSRKTVNGDWTTPILPGHRYLVHTAFPGDEGFEEGTRPQQLRECASCAIEREDYTATLYGICGSFCCGVEPCVLPFRTPGTAEHEHACRRCVDERQRDLVTAGAPVAAR